jgi:hypothetical protein
MSARRNHYDNLKVARNAPTEVIEAAYRALCEKYRLTYSRGSVLRARKITDSAYFVLSDPLRREQHDEWIRQVERQSLFKLSFKRRMNRILATGASGRVRLIARSRPYFVHSVVLIVGLFVGWPYFAAWSRHETTVQLGGNTRPVTAYHLTSGAVMPLSTPTELPSKSGPLLFGPNENVPTRRRVSVSPPAREEQTWVRVGEDTPISNRVSHSWRQSDPNGNPWPRLSGLIDIPTDLGCPHRVGNGLASSTIDNVGNSYDVFVKLVANPDSPSDRCSVAWIMVKAHDRFRLEGMNAGQYSIFFRDLFSGTTEKTPAVALDSFSNTREKGGDQYYVTVYARPDGNLRPISISDDVFEAI